MAAWVAANSATVLAYYPCDDAGPSGVMADQSGNGRHGVYGSSVAAGILDGATVADLPGDINGFMSVADAAWLDLIAGIFCVVEFDAFATVQMIVCRDTTTDRNWQFRLSTGGVLQHLQVVTGNPTRSGPTLITATSYTVGVGSYSGIHFVVDGVPATETGTSGIFETGTSPMYIGKLEFASPDDSFLNGRIGSLVFLSAASDAAFAEIHAAWAGE